MNLVNEKEGTPICEEMAGFFSKRVVFGKNKGATKTVGNYEPEAHAEKRGAPDGSCVGGSHIRQY